MKTLDSNWLISSIFRFFFVFVFFFNTYLSIFLLLLLTITLHSKDDEWLLCRISRQRKNSPGWGKCRRKWGTSMKRRIIYKFWLWYCKFTDRSEYHDSCAPRWDVCSMRVAVLGLNNLTLLTKKKKKVYKHFIIMIY